MKASEVLWNLSATKMEKAVKIPLFLLCMAVVVAKVGGYGILNVHHGNDA